MNLSPSQHDLSESIVPLMVWPTVFLGVFSTRRDKMSIAACINRLVGALRPHVDRLHLTCRGGCHRPVITRGAP